MTIRKAVSITLLRKRCAEMGVTLEEHSKDYEAVAPDGKVFAGNGTHTVVAAFFDPDEPEYREGGTPAFARIAIWMDLDYGLEDCEVTDCDVCGDYGDVGTD
jgi:hypothetical protein